MFNFFKKTPELVPEIVVKPDVYDEREVIISLKTITGDLFTYTSADVRRNNIIRYHAERCFKGLRGRDDQVRCTDSDGDTVNVMLNHVVWYKRIAERDWK